MRPPLLLLAFVLAVAPALGQVVGEHPLSSPAYGPVERVTASSIASDGDGFLAVWFDLRDRSALYTTHIARDGAVADRRGILLARAASPVAVAWMGDRYLVAWNGAAGSIVGTQFSADGEILAPARVIAKGQLSNAPHPIASNGSVTVLMTNSGYSVLDHDCNVVEQGRFGASAYVTGSGEFILPGYGSTRHLDAAGHYLNFAIGMPLDLVACRGGGCITALFATSKTVRIATYDPATLRKGESSDLPMTTGSLDVVATEDGYLLVGAGTAQRLDDAGHPVGQPIGLPVAPFEVIRAASNGRDVAVMRISSGSLTAFVITPASVTGRTILAVSANAQANVAIAKSAFNYLAAWTEKDGTYAARLSLDGSALDGRGRFLGASTDKTTIAFDGTSYFVPVLHPSSADTDVLRIDPATGMVLAVSTIAGNNVRIGSNGSERVAVWTDLAGALEVGFLDPNGAIASMPVRLADQPSPQSRMTFGNPSLAWNGTMWLVTWEEQVRPYPTGAPPPIYPPVPILPAIAIRAVRLSAALTPMDVQPIAVASAPSFPIRSSHVASDGTDFVVAWTTDAVRVRRVSASGVVDPERVLVTATVQDLVWDGAAYDVAFATPHGDLAAARLRSSGEPIETLVISATPADERSAALIPTTTGHVLAAYTRVADEPLYGGVERAFVRMMQPVRGRAVESRERQP
jgi:hypothetical protein